MYYYWSTMEEELKHVKGLEGMPTCPDCGCELWEGDRVFTEWNLKGKHWYCDSCGRIKEDGLQTLAKAEDNGIPYEDELRRIVEEQKKFPPFVISPPPFGGTGWICPRCGTVNAPFVRQCTCQACQKWTCRPFTPYTGDPMPDQTPYTACDAPGTGTRECSTMVGNQACSCTKEDLR